MDKPRNRIRLQCPHCKGEVASEPQGIPEQCPHCGAFLPRVAVPPIRWGRFCAHLIAIGGILGGLGGGFNAEDANGVLLAGVLIVLSAALLVYLHPETRRPGPLDDDEN